MRNPYKIPSEELLANLKAEVLDSTVDGLKDTHWRDILVLAAEGVTLHEHRKPFKLPTTSELCTGNLWDAILDMHRAWKCFK